MTWKPEDHGGCLECRAIGHHKHRYLVACQHVLYLVRDNAKRNEGWTALSANGRLINLLPGTPNVDPDSFELMGAEEWELIVRYV